MSIPSAPRDDDAGAADDAAKTALVTVCAPAPRRGHDETDRKLQALAPLWRGLALPSFPEPGVFAAALRDAAPAMEPFRVWLEGELALQRALGAALFQPPPILLHGPPGVGKTHLARTLAEALGAPHRLLGLAGASDVRTLLGTSAGYATGAAGLPAQLMAETGCAAPVILLDELDKVSRTTANGSWVDALLPFLEPVSARALFDEFLLRPVDCSRLAWIATANDTRPIPRPLLSRFACFEVAAPDRGDPVQTVDLAARAVARDLGLDPAAAALADPALRRALALPPRPSIRDAKAAIRNALAAQIRSATRH